MAATPISFTVTRDGLWSSGPSEVTPGNAAPTTAGTLEVRIDADPSVGWTKNEIELAMDRIHRYILDVANEYTTGEMPL